MATNEDWLKENYEKAVLIAATVIALVVAGMLIFSSFSFGEIFENNEPPRKDEFEDTGVSQVETAGGNLLKPVKWDGQHLLVSAPVLEDFEGGQPKLVAVTGEGDSVHDPMTNAWIMRWGLDITQGNLGDQDEDGDNYSNLEEFLGKTDPTDAEKHPDPISKLCLASMVTSDLKLVFRTKVDANLYQIDIVSEEKYRSQNKVIGIGDRFGPNNTSNFKLEKYIEKKGVGAGGVPEDNSEAVVSYMEAGGTQRVRVNLVRNDEWEMPTHTGNFLNRYNGEEFEVKRGDSFKLSNDPDNTFTLIEVNAGGAILKDQNGKDLKISPCE